MENDLNCKNFAWNSHASRMETIFGKVWKENYPSAGKILVRKFIIFVTELPLESQNNTMT